MVRRMFSGRLDYLDDEPIELDCGCTAYPGDDYEVHTFDVYSKNNAKGYEKLTCCSDGCECTKSIWYKVLNKHHLVHYTGYDTRHCFSAAEEKKAHDDYIADMYEDDD